MKLTGIPASAEIVEGNSVVLIPSISNAQKTDTTISIVITSNDAAIGDVFAGPNPVTALVSAGQTSVAVPINSLDDSIYTGDREFLVTVSIPDQTEKLEMRLLVRDNEPVPVISFAQVAQSLNENIVMGSATVQMTPATNRSVTIQYFAVNGTATAAEYTLAPGSITFAPGETSKPIAFLVADDAMFEADKTFSIELGAITGVAHLDVAKDTHVVTILDDDAAPVNPPLAFDDGVTTSGRSKSPKATWTKPAGVAKYEIAIGSSSGATDVLGWTDVGDVDEYTALSLALNESVTYFTSIRSVDAANNRSTIVTGDGWNVSWIGHAMAADPNGYVIAMKYDSLGRKVIGGGFTAVGGVTKNSLARYNTDGTLDTGFNSGSGFNGAVRDFAFQSDGRLIVAGEFTSYNGVARSRMVRLNVDGTLDTTFQGGTFNFHVYAVYVKPDDKIVAGGGFNYFAGGPNGRMYQGLLADGSIDPAWPVDGGFNWQAVTGLNAQSDGKIIVTGVFTSFNHGTVNQTTNRIARIFPDGSLDTTFNSGGTGANNHIWGSAIQSDDKIIIVGNFTTYNGVARNRIARLNADGTLDLTFNPGTGFNGAMNYVAKVLSTGKILVGGGFTTFNGNSIASFARLNADGSFDSSFRNETTFDYEVLAIAEAADGSYALGGDYSSAMCTDGNPHGYFIELK